MRKALHGQSEIVANSYRVGSVGGDQVVVLSFSICLRSYLRPHWNIAKATTPPQSASQRVSSQSAFDIRNIMKFPIGNNFSQYARCSVPVVVFMVGAILGAVAHWGWVLMGHFSVGV